MDELLYGLMLGTSNGLATQKGPFHGIWDELKDDGALV
jgi:hypothetical protein